MDQRKLTGIFLVLVSACSFGSGALFAKPAYATGVDWLTLLAWRFAMGASLAWVWLLASPARRAGLRATPSRELVAAVGLGALYTINAGTYYAALQTVPASLAALIVYLYPVLTAVLSLRFGRPLLGRGPWIALAIASAGVALAVGGIDPAHLPPVTGIVLVFVSTIVYSGWIILSARLGGERRDGSGAERASGASAAVASAVMMTSTAALVLVLAIGTGRPLAPDDVPSAAWPPLIGIGLVSTFIAIQTFYAGARRIGAAQAALISTVEPVYTIVLARILFGELLTTIQLVGGALILAAVLIAQRTARGAEVAPEFRLADE